MKRKIKQVKLSQLHPYEQNAKKHTDMKPEKSGNSRDEKGRFIKGISGNPAGKPEGTLSITSLIKKELEKAPEGSDKLSLAQAFIKKILHKAIIEGDHATQKMIWSYIDGMPKGSWDLTSGGEKISSLIAIQQSTQKLLNE